MVHDLPGVFVGGEVHELSLERYIKPSEACAIGPVSNDACPSFEIDQIEK